MLRHSYTFEAFGAPWSIDTNDELSLLMKEKIQKRIEMFDSTYSRFRPDSLVSSISKKAGTYVFPDDFSLLFGFYKQLYDATDAKVTPLIGDAISNAGYDANYSFIDKQQKPVLAWDDAMEWNGLELTAKAPFLLDIGAAGKGYMVDIISTILDNEGIKNYVVDGSGDLRHKGDFENVVGLEHPFEQGTVIGTIDVRNRSMCASATNRRTWGNGMHHIFDPVSLLPTEEIVATWAVADDAMVADGLATALFFTDPIHLRKTFEFDYARIFANGSIEYSSFFEGGLF